MAAGRNTSTAAAAEAPFAGGPPAPASAWRAWAWAGAAGLGVAVLHTAAFPPFGLPEGAYVFAVPAFLWCLRSPRWKPYLWTMGAASFLSWLVLLEWLRVLARESGPIALLGWVALAAVLALFPFGWLAALRWATPRAARQDAFARCLIVVGLAGLWVVLEWVRSWLFSGFPWLTLAASQWQRPVMLQAAAYGGAWAVSFALVVFNLGLAAYCERLYRYVQSRQSRLCPEFYLGLVALFAVSFGLYGDAVGQQRERLVRAGALQPDIPQSVKWDPAETRQILDVLETETTLLSLLEPDAVFWPEAVTPLALVGDPGMQAWTEQLARHIARPIVLGAIAYEELPAGGGDSAPGERWSNGVFVVDPELGGLQRRFYAKRHLVPFGEFVPLRRWLPFLSKVVPVGGDFTPGGDATPLLVRSPERTLRVGTLICYEDVFPALARGSVKAGAQVLFVATNNAWFGEGGAAFQHAAHSVLRAVETRRPVMRVGNAGWSGWIDEFGSIRDVMRDDRGSIYHRGSAVFTVDRDRRWVGRETLYVRWGDWFVGVSALLAVAGAWTLRAADRPRIT